HPRPPPSPLFPSTTLFRSHRSARCRVTGCRPRRSRPDAVRRRGLGGAPVRALGMPAAVACLLVLVVALQGGERLRKTDLVRLLSSVTLAPDELAALIRRNCLSFTPSGRDRADFVALGAGPVVLREIDACVRR